MVVFAVVFAVASFGGRLTVPENSQVALIWPSSGVAFVWFVILAVEPRRVALPRSVSGVLVVVTTSAAALFTGASPGMAVGLAGAALVSAWSGAKVFLRWCGQRDGTLVNRRGLRALVLAAFVSSVLGACVVGLLSVAMPPLVELDSLVLWIMRSTSAVVIIGAVGLRWLYDDPHRWRIAEPWAVALNLGLTLLFAVIIFRPGQSWPLGFLILAVATSAATLLTVQWMTIYLLGVSVVTITANLSGAGPFALTGRWESVALAQAALTALAYSTVGLSLEHDLRNRALEDVIQSRVAEREQSELLTSLYAMLSDAVVLVDEFGLVAYANAAADPFLDGGRLSTAALPSTAFAGIDSALRGEPPSAFDVELVDGSRILSMSARALTHRGRRQALAVLTDVTRDRHQQRQLKSFAGTLAHDLRGPLTSMSMWAQLLEEEVSHTETGIDPTPILRINASTHRMATLISDVLAFSLAGDGPIRAEAVELAPLAADVVREQLEARQSAGAAPMRIDIDMPHTVHADPVLLRQLLDNYIGNALKYARPGAKPEARVSSQATADGFVRIAVQDRGVGLPAGEEDRVFEEFHRAPQHVRLYEGTGLGLSICRRIAERHGGRTWAIARPGGGSCFFATFPQEATPVPDSCPSDGPLRAASGQQLC